MGDLNGDGHPDLAAHGYYVNEGLVWLNDGNGNFSQAPSTNGCQNIDESAIVDLDGDGINDVIRPAYDLYGAMLYACANDGKGVLSERNYASGNFDYPGQMSIADFNRDGLPDVVQTMTNPNVGELTNPGFSYEGSPPVVAINRGNFGFGLSSVVATGFATGDVVPGDFDGDGAIDLIRSGDIQGMVVARGRGDGTFQGGKSFGGNLFSNPVLADANGDGLLDILSGRHALMLGAKNHFKDAIGTYSGGDQTFADLDGDGALDAIAPEGTRTGGDGSVGVFMRTGLSSFAPAVQFQNVCKGPLSAAAADFDGDGDADVGVACVGQYLAFGVIRGEVLIMLNSGNGTLSSVQHIKTNIYNPARIIADNFGQKTPRLVVLDEGDNGVKLLTPAGGGSFNSPQTVGSIEYPTGVNVGDVNGDGNRDLLLVGGLDTGATFGDPIPDGQLEVIYGNSAGSFSGGISAVTVPGPVNVSAGNLDGDGRDDILVSSYVSGALGLYRPIGDNGGLVSPP